MKFLKNKIVQTLSAITLIAIIGVVVYISSDTKVKADDTVTMQYVKQEIANLQTQIDTLNITIEEQQKEIENLKTENVDLKTNVSELKIETTNIKKNVNSYEKDIAKLNSWYNKNDELYSPFGNRNGINLYYDEEYIKSRLKMFFSN